MKKTMAAMAILLAVSGSAAEAGETQGLELLKSLAPTQGFVDSPFAFDASGKRMAYVNADAAGMSTINVFDVNKKQVVQTVNLAGFTTAPEVVEFAGSNFFVMERSGEESRARAALVAGTGQVIRTFGPATDIVQAKYNGQPVVVVYEQGAASGRGRKGARTKHTVTVHAQSTGKIVGKPGVFYADVAGRIEELEFRLLYWTDNYTSMVGIKDGVWDRKEDQRAPDYEAWYDVPQGKFTSKVTISNVIEHTRRMQILAAHSNENGVVSMSHDLSKLMGYVAGVGRSLPLAEPLHHYNHQSLRYHGLAGGGVFFSMTIDPVHPDAAAERRAVPEWIDFYLWKGKSDQPVRKGRIRAEGLGKVDWIATNNYVAILKRHKGFSRGGPEISIYRWTASAAR